MPAPLRLRYVGPFARPTGYARAGHDYCLALHRLGVDLDIVPIHDADPDDLEPRYRELLDHVLRGDDEGFEATHHLVHTIPRYASEFVTGDLAPAPGVKKIAVVTWETDRLPRDDASRLNENFDAVIVPCRLNALTFVEAGLPPDKVHVVPHCWDPGFWDRGWTPKRPASPFVFYTIGVWSSRKNLGGLLRAYLSEFRSSDDVVLKIVTPFRPETDLQTLVARLGLSDLPAVQFCTDRLSEEDLRDLHRTSHCYVTAARGEGWGLGAFEAAITGNVVIAPAFGGQADFLSDYPGWRVVRHQMTPAVADEMQATAPIEVGGIRITPLARAAPTGIAADQNWAEPDLVALKYEMRRAFGRRRFEERHAADALERYTYDRVGHRLKTVLEAL